MKTKLDTDYFTYARSALWPIVVPRSYEQDAEHNVVLSLCLLLQLALI